MTNTPDSGQRGKLRWWRWLRGKAKPLAGLILVIAIVVVVFYLYWRAPGLLERLKGYGYLGVFIISIILNATIILPVSNMAVMMALGAAMPLPFVVGLVGALGAAIGEMTGYIAGRSGRDLIARKIH